ncbi:MAG TPA: ABC transporter ATP-binding protein, partial [Vicinamibacterales bacterium]|nr:ABC transporter ATP-binding protein [Vicinamibacterales bacterium]
MLVQVADVRFGYRQRRRSAGGSPSPVLDGVTVRIPEGGLVGILGPNGSGKTTLLKLVAGALVPETGTILLGGQPASSIPRRDLARRLAVVPQETHLAFDYTALEVVLMGRYPHLAAFEIEGPRDLEAAMAAMAATATSAFADRAFMTLSGGEKQRVVIASALAQLDGAEGPALLLLDEPTASLDLRYQLEVADLLRRLHRDRRFTILLTTHDLRF